MTGFQEGFLLFFAHIFSVCVVRVVGLLLFLWRPENDIFPLQLSWAAGSPGGGTFRGGFFPCTVGSNYISHKLFCRDLFPYSVASSNNGRVFFRDKFNS